MLKILWGKDKLYLQDNEFVNSLIELARIC